MTLTATVFWLVLSASAPSDGPTNTDLKPSAAAAPTPGAVNFDALPPVPGIPEDARVKRFLGAFTGGVVGLGASLALMPLGDSLGCFGGPCVSFIHGMVGVFAPLLALGGSWLGFELMGGDGGLVTPAVALAPAILMSLGLLSIAREADANTVISMMPYLITAGVFLAGGAALALDLRARQVNALGAAQSWGKANAGRVAIASLVSGLSTAGVALLSGLFFGLAYSSPLFIGLGFATALAGSFGVAAASWGVHRALNGRGTFASSLAGLGIGMLATLAGAGLFALSQGGFTTFSPVRNSSATILLVELGVAAALFSPVLALEFSHTSAVQASLPTFSLSASPTPSGGMVAAGMRF